MVAQDETIKGSLIVYSFNDPRANLAVLALNPYPGRGLAVGMDETGEYMVQVYWIMGRSENSRNRLFKTDCGRLFTAAADPSKVKDPSLIIYDAMLEGNGYYTVSNGAQTETALIDLSIGNGFRHAMRKWSYEPDGPNFTPRITALCALSCKPFIEMCILRRSTFSPACDASYYEFDDVGVGRGYCLTTYLGDGEPLPSYRGDPFPVPFDGGIEKIADTFWQALNADNRVSLVVKFINEKTGESSLRIVNKYAEA